MEKQVKQGPALNFTIVNKFEATKVRNGISIDSFLMMLMFKQEQKISHDKLATEIRKLILRKTFYA